ncbi:hypothetical protein [Terracoccus sp. 273MFTsu3.1]|uniref:hypothetical protein n=1 Tax=Terracoccus sp. 273MFTsu3.1 TaxID=1172188 RepID=UPI0012DF3293|nr:hypothetical protein [Terracoccus sp. 273MFTsu3.1]
MGLVVGWLVGGYQRITEKLIEERRDALAKLLEAADDAHAVTGTLSSELTKAVARAELVCSPQMADSGLIRTLASCVASPAFDEVRARFLTAARADGSTVSIFARAGWWWWHRRSLVPDQQSSSSTRVGDQG